MEVGLSPSAGSPEGSTDLLLASRSADSFPSAPMLTVVLFGSILSFHQQLVGTHRRLMPKFIWRYALWFPETRVKLTLSESTASPALLSVG